MSPVQQRNTTNSRGRQRLANGDNSLPAKLCKRKRCFSTVCSKFMASGLSCNVGLRANRNFRQEVKDHPNLHAFNINNTVLSTDCKSMHHLTRAVSRRENVAGAYLCVLQSKNGSPRLLMCCRLSLRKEHNATRLKLQTH